MLLTIYLTICANRAFGSMYLGYRDLIRHRKEEGKERRDRTDEWTVGTWGKV